MQTLYLVVPLAPLAAAILVGLFGAKLGRAASHSLCIAGVAVSTVASYFVWRDVGAGHMFNGDVYIWLQSGGLKLAIGFLIDPLTATMMLVVSFVSLMVHVYTIGYMADARDEQQLPPALLRMGGGRARIVSADRLLVYARKRDLREPQSVPCQSRR